jgi:hypothetical protein
MEYVTGRLVPHHRAERHSDWLLFEAAGLTSSSAGELAITAFLQHGYLPPLFSHPSLGDRPKPKPGASRLPPEAGPAIHCQSTPPSILLFGRLLHSGATQRRRDSSSRHHKQADNVNEVLVLEIANIVREFRDFTVTV